MAVMSLFVILVSIAITMSEMESNSKVMEEEIGIDWWDILKADATCCPGNTDEASCNAEAGSSCVWFPKPNNQIALEAGSQCVGQSYVKCKRRLGIQGCCTPKCNPAGPGNPNPPTNSGPNQTPPVCGPIIETTEPTTPTPTDAPTSACELGVNYAFEGQSCVLSGDPHTTMFNGNKHDFQGQPLTEYGNTGELMNQYYYIHPCDGVSDAEMPIKALITHYHWGTRSVSGADYITLILTENDGGNKNRYYVYMSSALKYYIDASNGGISTDYDIANGNGVNFNTLVSGQQTSIGRRFKVLYTNIQSNYKSYFVVTIDDEDEFKVYMQAQPYQSHSGRYAMHYLQMNVPSALKCYTCGLCGDFNTVSSGQVTESMEGCDGSSFDYRQGWSPTNQPEAFDCSAWSWEKHYVDDESCPGFYDNTDLSCSTNQPQDPCPAGSTVAGLTDDACEAAIASKQSCCNTIGNGMCDGLLSDCKVDVCAAANGDTSFDFDAAVQGIIIDPIEAVCADPELNPVPPTETRECDLTGQSIVVSQGNEVCRIDIGDTMIIEMEIRINEIDSKSDTWESVFHVGNENMQRWPGLWVHPQADQEGQANDGFHISYGTTTHSNPYGPTSAAGPAYYDGDTIVYKSIQTQERLTIIENGITIFDQTYDPHPTATNVAVYIGDPWYVPADMTISNLVIKSLDSSNTNDALLLYHQSIPEKEGDDDVNNTYYIQAVMCIMILCGIGLYIRSKRNKSKEYMALTSIDEKEKLINKQYSSCNQV